MYLYFFRHGETENDTAGILTSPGDMQPLTSKGLAEAGVIAEFCCREGIHNFFSSPEARALETVAICIKGEIASINIVLDGLCSRNWGQWTGKTWDEVRTTLSALSLKDRYVFRPPQGETWQEMEARIRKALDEIVTSGHEKVAVITHGAILRALMPLVVQNQGLEEGIKYTFDTGTVTKIKFENGLYKIECVNQKI